jgi:beta-glucosidase-like glycosyl hydrolase
VDTLDCPQNRALAREVARQSIVMLKNTILPLQLKTINYKIAVIGPNANDTDSVKKIFSKNSLFFLASWGVYSDGGQCSYASYGTSRLCDCE